MTSVGDVDFRSAAAVTWNALNISAGMLVCGNDVDGREQPLTDGDTYNFIHDDFSERYPADDHLCSSGYGYDYDSGKPWATVKHVPGVIALLTSAYTLVAVIGTVSNALVVAIVVGQPSMRQTTNYFLANLATADILVCLFVLPITLLQNIYTEMTDLIYGAALGLKFTSRQIQFFVVWFWHYRLITCMGFSPDLKWWYGPIICKVAPYLQGIAVGASVNTLVAVAIERCVLVFTMRPVRMTSRTAAVVMATTWAIPGVLFVPWLLVYRQQVFPISGFDYVVCHADWSTPTHNVAFTVGVVFLTCYLVPLVVIAMLYLLIGIKVLRRRVNGLRHDSRAAVNISRTKSRVVRMLVIVFVVFAVSWLPLYIVNIRVLIPSVSTTERMILKSYIFPVAQWLGASNSCVNPFIYFYFSRRFRSGLSNHVTSVASLCDQRKSASSALSRAPADELRLESLPLAVKQERD